MIGEFLLNIIFTLLTGMLSILPDISWSVDNSFFSVFLDIVRVGGYLLPMGTVTAIISLVIALTIFRIVISLVKTIWELLPIV